MINPISRLMPKMSALGSKLQGMSGSERLLAGINFIGKHQGALGAGIGALGGYVGSGGELGGAVVGGAVGGISASKRDWGVYDPKGGSRWGRKITGRLGKVYSQGPAAGLAQAIGPKGRNFTYTSGRSGGSMTEFRNMPGHARNVGGKMMATAALAPWQMGGAGAIGGMAYGLGKSAIGGIGSTFGSEKRSHYGTSFSGMGNGSMGPGGMGGF